MTAQPHAPVGSCNAKGHPPTCRCGFGGLGSVSEADLADLGLIEVSDFDAPVASLSAAQRRVLAVDPDTDPDDLVVLITAEEREVRAGAYGNVSTPPQALAEAFASERDMSMRSIIAGNRSTPPETLAKAANADGHSRNAAAANPSTPPDVLHRLVSVDESLAYQVAGNRGAWPDTLRFLAAHRDPKIADRAERVLDGLGIPTRTTLDYLPGNRNRWGAATLSSGEPVEILHTPIEDLKRGDRVLGTGREEWKVTTEPGSDALCVAGESGRTYPLSAYKPDATFAKITARGAKVHSAAREVAADPSAAHSKAWAAAGERKRAEARAMGIGVGDPATKPVPVAGVRRRMEVGTQYEAVFVRMGLGDSYQNPQPLTAERRTVVKQNGYQMVTERPDGTHVYNDWAGKKAEEDVAGNIIISDNDGPYVAYRPVRA